MAQPIIICESKVWDKQFVNNLKEALDRSVIHITDKHKLNLNDIREINPEYIFSTLVIYNSKGNLLKLPVYCVPHDGSTLW